MIRHENNYIKKYFSYLKFEKNLQENSISAYLSDIVKLKSYASTFNKELPELKKDDITNFICELHDMGIHPRSQARILSGVKSFFRFLLLDGFIDSDPADLIESPKLGRKLPDVLSLEEIDMIISSIDLSTKEGQRNRVIIEVLYSCGVRVSELINIKLSDIYPKEGFIVVTGKGDKQRIVPIAESSLKEISNYMIDRNMQNIKKGNEDILFINRLGTSISRISIFNIIKAQCEAAGIKKNVSPHTFRHSFATHLLEGGANLRAIQLMLGHEKISTTEIYTHIDKSFVREEILIHHPRNNNSGVN